MKTGTNTTDRVTAALTANGYRNAPVEVRYAEFVKLDDAGRERHVVFGWHPQQRVYCMTFATLFVRNGALIGDFIDGGNVALWPTRHDD